MVSMVHGHLRGPARGNSNKRHGPISSDSLKMKSQQETTSLGQIATVTAKPSISDNFITLTRDVLKFRRVTSLNSNPEALYKDIWYMSL